MFDSSDICYSYWDVDPNERTNKLFVTAVWETLSDQQQEDIMYAIKCYMTTKQIGGKKLGGGASRVGYRISNSLVCKLSRINDNWGGYGGQTRSEFEMWITVENHPAVSGAIEMLSPTIAMFGDGDLIFQFFCSNLDQDFDTVHDKLYEKIHRFEREVDEICNEGRSSGFEYSVIDALRADNHRGNIRKLGSEYVKIDYGI